MTSITDCIQRAVDAKDLHAKQGRQALADFEQLRQRYESIYPPAQAAAMAAADLKEATRKAARSRRHAVLHQLQAARRLIDAIDTAPDPARVLRELVEGHTRDAYRGESVRSVHEALMDTVNAGLKEVLDAHHLDIAGNVTNRAGFMNLIRELHGQATGDAAAAKLADAVRYQQRRLRQFFNALGGDIGELADYGVAHAHSADALVHAGFDKWADDIFDKLAWHQIEDKTTGKAFTATPGARPNRAAARRFLQNVYDGIITGGWDDRVPGATGQGKALYDQRAEHRVLHFKDGDAWIAYNAAYGAADPFSAMLHGLHGLARDVALMKVLGPNPRAGLDLAIQAAQKRAADLRNPQLARRVERQGKLARVMLAHADGSVSVPDHARWAAFFSGTRATLASIQLGSAVLSSVTDAATIRIAAKTIGLNPVNVATRTMALSLDGMARETAGRLGYVAHTLAEAGASHSRFMGGMIGTGLPSRLSNFTMRASGLTFITDMRRMAFQMETSAHLAANAHLPWAQMEPRLRQMLDRRGIGAADWDLLRDPAHRFTAPSGEDFISGHWFLEHQTALPRIEAEGLALRLQAAIREELEFALPTTSIEGRALMQGETKPGSIPGELLRSTTSYKGYPLSLMLSQSRRFMMQQGGWAKAGYAANVLIPLILMGAVAVQLKELAKGNDPRPMTDLKFWQAALLQSGGLGIFGDFFAAESSRTGGGLAETLAGPVVGLAGDVIGLAAEPVTAGIEGRDINWGRALSRFQRQNTPVASSLWYGRLAFDRIVSDNLQRLLDPEAERDWRRREKQKARDYGITSWWHQGDLAPDRAPDLGNVAGR